MYIGNGFGVWELRLFLMIFLIFHVAKQGP